jgi:thermitase
MNKLLGGICIALLLAFLGEGWYVGQVRSELMETKMQLVDAWNRIAHLEHQSRAPSELWITNDPYADQQWALTEVQALTLWGISTGNRGILVAVLDTGIDTKHEDLKGKVVAEVNFTDSPTPYDIYGHGTHIAGIIAANSNNGIGITGVAPESRLMNVKVANDKRQCQASAVAHGIVWAVDKGAHVINISLQFAEPSAELENAVNYAWSQGAVIIAAAGNEGGQSPVYPAFYENCIAVAATSQDGSLAPLSNRGDWVDVAAPGFNIYSTLPNNSYGYKSGTSFAVAHISGLAALLFDVVRDTNGDNKINDEVRAAIESAYSIKRLRS